MVTNPRLPSLMLLLKISQVLVQLTHCQCIWNKFFVDVDQCVLWLLKPLVSSSNMSSSQATTGYQVQLLAQVTVMYLCMFRTAFLMMSLIIWLVKFQPLVSSINHVTEELFAKEFLTAHVSEVYITPPLLCNSGFCPFSMWNLDQIWHPMAVLKSAHCDDSKTPPTCLIWWSFGWDIWGWRKLKFFKN